jgi:hypothetical protein
MLLIPKRRPLRAALICRLLCAFGLLQSSLVLQCQQIVTIGSLTRSVGQLASTLNSLGEASLENGQLNQGQQQLLLAGTLQAMSSRLADAYSGELSRPINALEQRQWASLSHLSSLLTDLGDLNEQTDSKSAQLILKTLDVAHEVFDNVPATDKPPVAFGVALPGVLTPMFQDSVVILGYHLVDATSNRNPEVTIADNVIPATSIEADFSKVVIHLTPSLMHSIGLGNTPCDPMRASTISLRTHYVSGSLSALLHLTSESVLRLPIRAPSPQYEFLVEETGTATVRTSQSVPFSNSSGYVSVGCEQTATATVTWQAPENAHVSAFHAQWVDVNNVSSQTQSVIPSGSTYLATGSIRGRDRQCVLGICNCPGGGHGNLVLSGTYELPDPGTRSFSFRQVVRGPELAQVKVPSQDTWTLNRLVIRITRKGCDTELDRLEIVPSDLSSGRDLPSVKGLFQVRVAGGVVAVRVPNPM